MRLRRCGYALRLAGLYLFGALASLVMAGMVLVYRNRSNCMIEVYPHWIAGATIVLAKTENSRTWRWPHFGVSYDGGKTWLQYVPDATPRRLLFPLTFYGSWKRWFLKSSDKRTS